MKRTKNAVCTMILALAFMVMSGVMSFADDETRFVGGTTVNGIKISGLTVDEAKEHLASFYANDYKLKLITKEGKEEYINSAAVGYQASIPDGLQSILDGQNAGGRITGPAAQSSHMMEVSGTFDPAKLGEQIQGLSCVSGAGVTQTRDAHISSYEEGKDYTIISEVYGNDLDLDKMASAIGSALKTGQADLNLESAGCYNKVNVKASDEQLKDLCSRMNRYKDMKITYNFSETVTEELPGSVFASWISVSEDGQVSVNQEEAAAYVKALAEKYDTADTVRLFHTSTGKDVELTGPYGWKMDQAAELNALTDMLLSGESQARTPQYTKTAAAREPGDWGNTYVEIDLTGQHVYMIQEGTLVWDAPCVTGNVSKNYTTPEGIYGLTYKEQDRILRGKKKADGSYEYESHVDYWMPFNGGIGLHDATWRGNFGGTIYQTNGSHGCINLPPDRAAILYSLVYKGMPVICYN